MTHLRKSEQAIYFIAAPLLILVTSLLIVILPLATSTRVTLVLITLLGVAYWALAYWLRTRKRWTGLRLSTPLVSVGLITASLLSLGAQAPLGFLLYFAAVIISSVRYGRYIGVATAAAAALGYALTAWFDPTSYLPVQDFMFVATNLFIAALLSGAMADEERAMRRAAQADRRRDQAALRALADALIDASDLTAMLTRALEITSKIFQSDAAAIIVPDDGHQVVQAGWGLMSGYSGRSFKTEDASITANAIATREAFTVSDLQQDQAFQAWLPERVQKVRAGLAVPMIRDGQVRSAFAIYSLVPRAFSADDEHLLSLMANQILVAIERRQAEHALQESEQQYRHLFENAPIGIYRTTPDGRVLAANPTLMHMLGYSSFQQLAARNLETDGADSTYPRNQFKEMLERTGEVKGLEANWLKRDGSMILVREHARAVRDAEGQVWYYEGTVEDITERRRIEEALRESEDRFRLLLEGVKDYAIMMLDPQGKVVSWNPGVERIIGYGREEIIGQHFSCFYLPQDVAQGAMANVLEVASGDGRVETEGWRVRKDGSQYWAHEVITALRDKDGRLRGFAKVTRDITERRRVEQALQKAKDELEARVAERMAELSEANEQLRLELAERKRAEQALRESEERYRKLVETSPDAIALTDLSSNIVMVNQQAVELFGYEGAHELIGRNAFDLIAPDDQLRAVGNAVRILESGGIRNIEYTLLQRDGTPFPADLSTSLVVDADDKPQALLSVVRDISERKRAEEALRESEARFRAVFEKAAIGLALRDMQGRAVETNPALQRFLGYSAAELRGRSFLDYTHADDLQVNRELFDELLEGRHERYELEKRYVRKDGRVVWGMATATLLRSARGEPKYVIGMVEDITERKRVEQELQEANAKLTVGISELERSSAENILLNEMGDLLQSCLTADEAYTVIAQSAQQLFPGEEGALFEFSASRNLVEAVLVWGEPAIIESVFGPDDCWAMRRGRAHVVHDMKTGLICPHVEKNKLAAAYDPVQAYVCVPMMAQGEALGVLHVQSHRTGQVLPDFKQSLARTVAERVGLALANLKLRETLRMQSIRDPLTGVFNRRYMEESLLRELRRATRNQRPLGVIMLDLDHFKQFNDQFGHEAGDTLLRDLGAFLKTHVRGEDIVCRYGGEEFTLILPEASLEDTRQRAEQLREGVKQLQPQFQNQSLGTITLSLGVSVFPEHGPSAEELLRAADAALYRAKAEGRDRVVVAGEK